jgi:parallel beta-helix repeat protein
MIKLTDEFQRYGPVRASDRSHEENKLNATGVLRTEEYPLSGLFESFHYYVGVKSLAGIVLGVFLTSGTGLAATLTVCSSGCGYSDLQTALATANTGDTVLVSPGTYTSYQSGSAGHLQGIFDIVNSGVTVQSTGGAASTILQVGNSSFSPTVRIQGNNTVLDGFTIQGAPIGVTAFSQTPPTHPITGIVIRNLIVNPVVSSSIGNGQGILMNQTSNSLVENCDIKNGYSSGISLQGGSSNNFVINNTVEQTNNATGYDLVLYEGSNSNVVAGNTLMNSGFGGMTIVGSNYNRVERNALSGSWASITLTDDPNHVPSNGNFVGNNSVLSSNFSTGQTYGTGVWLNDNATGNFVFNNVLTGLIENSIAIFNSTSNLIRGNYSYHNQQGGLDMTTDPGSYPSGLAPVNNVIQHNVFTDLQFSALFYISKSGVNDIGFNVTATGPTTQVSGSESTHFVTDNGISFYHNTLIDSIGNTTTIDVAGADVTATRIFMNRMFAAAPYYQFSTTGNSASWDGGAHLGGNFWSGFSANGDPSNGSTPFTNFNGGTGTDRYPYQHETYGKPVTLQVTQPNASQAPSIAAGSQKTIAWASAGCVYVDISYKRTAGTLTYIVQNYPDGGYYSWAVPSNLPAGTDYQIQIDCKSSNQALAGVSSSSLPFAVTSNSLTLLSPNFGAMTNSGSPVMVAWRKSAGITGVDVLYSTGSAYSLLAANVANDSTTVTLPYSVNSNQVSLLIRDSNNYGNADSTDGTFTSRGGTAQFTSLSGVSTLAYGTEVPLQWISPVNSAYVNITLMANGSAIPVATSLADFGHYSWLVPDNVGTGAYLQLTFLDVNSTNLGTLQSGTFSIAATVPPSPPSIVSLTPSSGTGTSQTFTLTGTSPAGASAITTLYLSFSGSGNTTCFMEFNRPANTLRLTDNSGNWQGPITIGSASTLSNSQCTLSGTGSSASTNGNNATVSFPLTFTAAFAGAKTVSASANDTNYPSGNPLMTAGSWTVPSAGPTSPPQVVLETPTNGASVSGIVAIEGYVLGSATGTGNTISSVAVTIDGTAVGTAYFGNSRTDVCNANPGRPGCPNVGFGYTLNTAYLTTGTHTIVVSATDSAVPPNTGTATASLTVSATQVAYYKVVNKNSGKVLDVTGISSNNGALIQQYDYLGGNNQQWQLTAVNGNYFEVVNRNSGKVLDVQGVSVNNGALIQQYDYLGGANQQWQLVPLDSAGNYEIVNKNSGKALDVQGSSTSDSALTEQSTYVGGANQQWQLVPVVTIPAQYYKITSVNTGKVLDVTGVSVSNGALIQQYDFLNGDNQKWSLVAIDATYFKIVNKHSAKVLDVVGVSTADGALIQQYDYLGGANQQWQFALVGSNTYKIVSKNSGRVLDVVGASTSNGALIQQYDYLGGSNQQWRLIPVQ